MDDLLAEQIAYYRARANEYEATMLTKRTGGGEATPSPIAMEWRTLERGVLALPKYTEILELACGTGIWTRPLTQHTEHLTALDAAPEMLEINRANVHDPRVQYERVDLFEWEPAEQYELVFIAFWLSHVPDARLDTFLHRVRGAMKPNGRVIIMDEPRGTKNVIPTNENVQARRLIDGRAFNIVKEYYEPSELRTRMEKLGFNSPRIWRGDYFFRLDAGAAIASPPGSVHSANWPGKGAT